MIGLELVLLLLAVSAGLRLVAERLNIPYATALVVGGLLLALIPGLPRIEIAPDVLFLVFIPPLLYSGAITFPFRDFRSAARARDKEQAVRVPVDRCAGTVPA